MINREKGVSLIIVFFVMVVIVAVILSVSTLLYSEIKIIRNVSGSVVSFYAADSGIEKVLYYDRKEKSSETAGRGICNICNACPLSDCENCTLSGTDCDPETCMSCQVGFSSQMAANKYYNLDIAISQQCKISGGFINSYGFYKNISRAIQLDLATKVAVGVPPEITCPDNDPSLCDEYYCHANGINTALRANVSDPDGSVEGVWASITGLGDENYNQCNPNASPCIYREIELNDLGNGTYQAQWNFGDENETYTVSIVAYDTDGNCSQIKANNISCQ